MIQDEKILISGVSGIVAQPLARFLAKNNEVWGIARFTDSGREIEQYNPATGGSPTDRDLSPRESLEAAGITTPRWQVIDANEQPTLPVPLVIKAPRQGSASPRRQCCSPCSPSF